MIMPLRYDDLLRMEAGSEIVYCKSRDGGLRLLNQLCRPLQDQVKAWDNVSGLVFLNNVGKPLWIQ